MTVAAWDDLVNVTVEVSLWTPRNTGEIGDREGTAKLELTCVTLAEAQKITTAFLLGTRGAVRGGPA